MVVLAYLRRRWSLSGREGLGFSLPPTELASAGFRRFRGNEMPIFLYAEGEKRWRTFGVFITEKLQPDAGPDAV
jgi:hypothetical protein